MAILRCSVFILSSNYKNCHPHLFPLQVIATLNGHSLAEAGSGRQGQLQISEAGYVWKNETMLLIMVYELFVERY